MPNPLSGTPGARLYRTGDLVRRRPDGAIEFLGRLDHQVKIRGFRVEPGEIEAALMALPGVREAVVVAREEGGDRRLVAYVVGEATVEGLRRPFQEQLRERLPDYMVPAAFVMLPALPLNPNGKVDRKALPAPDRQGSGESHLAPRTPVEEVLAGVWAELLGLERVGANDHFFELGGHSLLATQVTSRLRGVFGIEMPLRDLFEAPVLADLAVRIEAARREGTDRIAPPLVSVPREGPLPLSFAQQRLWFIDQLEPDSPLYNIPAALRLEGPLDPQALAGCFGEIVRRHEALRTVFAVWGGEPVQVIRPAEPFVLPVVDLSSVPGSLVLALAREEADRPFDLVRGPLLRAVLLRLGKEDHVLALTVHHIVSDGWSMGILVREVAALYDAPSPLPELPVQSGDFAVWQRSWLTGEVLEGEIDVWRRQLAGLPPLLELPTDRPRPAVQGFRGAARPVRLPAGLTRELEALARREGATLFMVLLAGFQTLLARTSGQDDLAVGAPVAGRNRVEIEGLIGFFVNTLVLRGDLTGEPSFRELLGRVRETALAAWMHQDVPFERLVEELAPERSLAHAPLVQVLFALQNAPLDRLEIRGLRLEPLSEARTTAKFDLSLSLREIGGEVAGTIEYATDLFDGTTIDRLAGSFERLLAAATATPERRAPELPLLDEAAHHQLRVEWNDTSAPAAPGVVELFEAQARRTPDAVAVALAEGPVLTYGELARRATALAARLRAQGIGPEVPVGLCVEPSPELAVGILGIFKSGGVWLPLDPSYPPARRDFLMEDSGAPLLITRTELMEGNLHPSPACGRGAGGEGLAYLIYTSGTTGRPKAVQVEHGMLAATLAATRGLFGFAAGDRMPCLARSTFDISLFELLSPLLTGGTALLFPQQPALDVEYLVDHLGDLTCLHAVPALLREIVESLRRRGAAAPDVGSLRAVFTGGDGVPAELLADLRSCFPSARVWVLYGPTEGTIVCAAHPVSPSPEPARSLLGRPLAGAVLSVCDRRGELVPPGVPGELWIGGAGVSRGYLGQAGLTAETYVPGSGGRFYRTGDRVRRLADGTLEFLGRLDQQVKVRGFRIEPGEIEAELAGLPGVSRAVVTVQNHRLVAYVVGDAAAEALRASLHERLPEYMVPSLFVKLPVLPLTPNGKVDRKALPAPHEERPAEGWLAPRTPVEEILAGIWAEVLGLDRVGANDHFFELGGHSLLATRVASRLRGAFGVEMPLRDLFLAPRLADLAARIEAAHSRSEGAAPPLVPVPREAPLPLSFAQERFWFLDQLEPGNPAYNIPGALALTGRLDVAAFNAALDLVVGRHEVLRTVFRGVDGALHQQILPSLQIRPPVLDLSSLPDEVRRAEAERLAVEHSRHRFDLARGPLLDAALLRLDAERHHVLLVLHHAICDGWSFTLLVREIGELYVTCIAGRPPSLPELRVQVADFAVWQRTLVAASGQAELAWWLDRLAGEIAPLDLPTDRARPAVQTWRGGRRSLVLPAGVAARLAAFGRAEGSTLFMMLLAAIQALLHRHGGQDDILVGAPVAGRRAVETENLIGCFLNTLVLRTDLGGAPGFRELVARVREVTLGAYSHQDVPFEAVLAALPQTRDLSRTPLFQVMVNLLNLPPAEMRLPGLAFESLADAAPLSKLDMTFYVREGDGVLVDLVYNADLFAAARMEDLLGQLALFLEQALDRPEKPVGSLSLFTAAARAVVPDPAAPLPPVWTGAVHERFAARARQHPDRPALTDRDGVWSYGELETAVHRLSGWLHGRGVRPGDRVAVYAHRSAPLAIALLGTLEAGAAFTILDPAYPAARLISALDATAPRAFLHVKAAGTLPAAVEVWLRDSGCPHLELSALERLAGLPGGSPVHSSGPDDLAWVSFTSGSTGMPKGVLGSHRPLSHFIAWHSERFGLTGTDRFSLLAGLAHDPLLRDLFAPLCLGALLAIPQPEELTSPDRFARWMRAQGVTVAHLTPALSEVLTETRGVPLESLRFAFFGGDVLTRRAVERLRGMAPGCVCVNYYGATETPQGMGFHEVSLGGRPGDRERIPVGKGIDGVQLLVLNAADRLAGVGELGEICIRTPYLALGYLHDEALTRERFIANPFTGAPEDRLYRTGDLGRYLPDGSVELQGRRDTQVKIRGFRIELGEIEAALSALPGMRQAVVLVREGALVAYVVGTAASEDLRERLPEYMVPSLFVTLDSLPLTPNGKVDRKALPAPDRQRESYQAPRTPAEEALAGIWAEVLGLERVGIADRFFDLGGHSLLATQVLSRVREAFGVEMPLRDLFEAPALSDLAARVESLLRAGALSAAPPLVPVPREGPLPLSFAQQRLWFIDRLQPGSALYNMPVALRIEGPLDLDVLVSCLGEIVRRHEALRTVFATQEGAPVQVIQPAEPFVLPVVDLTDLSDRSDQSDLKARHARALAQDEARRPFDLTRGPLLRAVLLRLANADHILALTRHHIVSDGWSMGLLVREVTALYGAFTAGRPSPLAELPVQYADYAVWQGSWLRGEILEREISFWRQQLAGLPPLVELPTDRPRPAVQSHSGASRPLWLPAGLTRREGATLFMVLLAGFQTLLARSSGQDDLAVGTPVAGRNRVEIEGLIGFFVNTLVVRGDLSGGPSFRELLGRVRAATLAAYTHQDVPFEKLVEELAPERSLGHTPLFQVMFALQNAPSENLEIRGLRLQPLSGMGTAAKFDLSLSLAPWEGGWTGTVEYATDLFDATTIDRLIGQYERLLAGATSDPDRLLADLPWLSDAESHQLLAEWNDTAAEAATGVVELFETQARHAPDAVAVVFTGDAASALTYEPVGKPGK